MDFVGSSGGPKGCLQGPVMVVRVCILAKIH